MNRKRRRLLIIGGGSSGLITLKTALEILPEWEVVCFEKSSEITGCWGRPYPGFVSTTTRFATQFASMVEYEASMQPGDETEFKQFFRDGDYGDYLERFADRFGLRDCIRLHHEVLEVTRADDEQSWEVTYRSSLLEQSKSTFDAVAVCTGLVAKPGAIRIDESTAECVVDAEISTLHERVRERRVVVCGGGESAVDTAVRLAKPKLKNRVYLSLRSGIRVSPRYHPIRGVPSDYLRTRLMLSIHPDVRNRLGDWFVRGRIKLERRFGGRKSKSGKNASHSQIAESRRNKRRRGWAMRLHEAAGEDLFDMFHNKSDGFLDAVAEGRIRIVGPPKDESWKMYDGFGRQDRELDVDPDVLVPAIGFRSSLGSLFRDPVELTDFYLGCIHSRHTNLFAIGFARPVIGNIPTISEMQAQFACKMLSGQVERRDNITSLSNADWEEKRRRFTTLSEKLPMVYPVEMFAYCDAIARELGCYPTLARCGSLTRWCKTQLIPASTIAYFLDEKSNRDRVSRMRVFLPPLLIAILLLLKPVDWLWRLTRRGG